MTDPLTGCASDSVSLSLVFSWPCQVDPLRVYICQEGVVRLCSEQYEAPNEKNLRDAYSHLTNYTLNKKNENYVHTAAANASDGDEVGDPVMLEKQGSNSTVDSDNAGGGLGSKRQLSDMIPAFIDMLGISEEEFWERINDLVAKTLIAFQPALALSYRQVFPGRKARPLANSTGGHSTRVVRGIPNRPQSERKEAGAKESKDAAEEAASKKKADEIEEDGNDSHRCFHILGIFNL